MLTLFGDICDPQPCRCLSHNGFLTRAGYRAVDGAGPLPYIDRVSSVRGLDQDQGHPIWDAQLLEEQYRRFHNGS